MAMSGRQLPSELTNVLNDYLGIASTPPVVGSASAHQASHPPSVILDIPDDDDAGAGTAQADGPAPGAHPAPQAAPAEDGQRPEILILWKLLWRYAPFLLLLFAKLMYEHRLGLLCLLGFYGTFYYANSGLKNIISTRELSGTSTMMLLFMPVYLFLNVVLVYYVFDEEKLYRCLIFLPANFEHVDLSTLLWMIGVTDFVLRFTSISLKACVAAVPKVVIPLKTKGKYYMLIEHSTQYYRRLTPIVPWYFFLTDSSRGGPWFSSCLWLVYAVFKLKSLFVKLKDLWKVFQQFMADTTYGVKPSHSDMSQSNDGCPICQDAYMHPIMLNCKHIFCEDCVSLWFDREQTCPMCRAKQVNDAPSWRDGSTTPFMQLF